MRLEYKIIVFFIHLLAGLQCIWGGDKSSFIAFLYGVSLTETKADNSIFNGF